MSLTNVAGPLGASMNIQLRRILACKGTLVFIPHDAQIPFSNPRSIASLVERLSISLRRNTSGSSMFNRAWDEGA
jgi:hypothetical protein